MTSIRVLFALAVYFISGYAVLSFVPRTVRPGLPPLTMAALCFVLGLGAVTLQMFLYSLAGLYYGALNVSVPWLALGAFAFARARKEERAQPCAGGCCALRETGIIGAALLVIILSQVCYAFIHALAVPITGWDAVQTWFFKATAFFADGRVKASFFSWDELVHPGYPLLVPLSGTWIYVALGKVSDQAARILYPLQFISLLVIFHYVLKRVSSARLALVFTAMLSLTPIIMVHAGGLSEKIGGLYSGDYVGYADLILTVYFLAAGGFLHLYAKERTDGFLILTALSLGLAAWTKDEGLIFMIIGVATTCGLLLSQRRGARPIITFVLIVAATALPWQFYKTGLSMAAHQDARISLSYALEKLHRLPVILAFFKFIMFQKTPLFNFTWYLFILAAVLNWRGFSRRPLALLYILLFAQFAAYVLVYMITVLDLNFHLATSCDRLVMQLTPLCLLITAINLKEFLSIGAESEQIP